MVKRKNKYMFFFGYEKLDGSEKVTVLEHIECDKNRLKDWITIFKRIFKVIKNDNDVIYF